MAREHSAFLYFLKVSFKKNTMVANSRRVSNCQFPPGRCNLFQNRHGSQCFQNCFWKYTFWRPLKFNINIDMVPDMFQIVHFQQDTWKLLKSELLPRPLCSAAVRPVCETTVSFLRTNNLKQFDRSRINTYIAYDTMRFISIVRISLKSNCRSFGHVVSDSH